MNEDEADLPTAVGWRAGFHQLYHGDTRAALSFQSTVILIGLAWAVPRR